MKYRLVAPVSSVLVREWDSTRLSVASPAALSTCSPSAVVMAQYRRPLWAVHPANILGSRIIIMLKSQSIITLVSVNIIIMTESVDHLGHLNTVRSVVQILSASDDTLT